MGLALGITVGLVLGLTGAGGSILAVPLLMWGMDWTILEAAPVALIAVAVASTLGTISAWDVAVIRYRAATLMALASMVTAPLGLLLAPNLPLHVLTLVLAGLLMCVAARMWWQVIRDPGETEIVRASVAGDGAQAAGPLCRLCPENGRMIWTRSCTFAVAGFGGLTGFLAGLFGVGGGFVIVPALRAISELSIHSAIATSLMAVALISSGSVTWALLLGRELPWLVAMPFVAGALLGMFAGRFLAPRVSGPRLQAGFAWLIIVIAIGLVVRTFDPV